MAAFFEVSIGRDGIAAQVPAGVAVLGNAGGGLDGVGASDPSPLFNTDGLTGGALNVFGTTDDPRPIADVWGPDFTPLVRGCHRRANGDLPLTAEHFQLPPLGRASRVVRARLAAGNPYGGNRTRIRLYPTAAAAAALGAALVDVAANGSGGYLLDANGTAHAPPDWAQNNALSAPFALTSSNLYVVYGDGTGAGSTALSYIGLFDEGPQPFVSEASLAPAAAPRLRRGQTATFTRAFSGSNSPSGAGQWTCTGGTLTVAQDGASAECTKNAADATYSVRWTSAETPATYAELSGMRRATVTGVTVAPQGDIPAGATRAFVATVAGLDNPPQDVTWQGAGGNTSGANFTAGPTLGGYAVQATSVDDPAFSGSASGQIVAPPSGVTPVIRVREGTSVLAEGGLLVGAGRRVNAGVVDRWLVIDNNGGREDELTGLAVVAAGAPAWLGLTLDDTVAPAVLRVRTTSPSAAAAADPDVVVTVASNVPGVAARTFKVAGAVAPVAALEQKVDELLTLLRRMEPQVTFMYGYAAPETRLGEIAATAVRDTPTTLAPAAVADVAEAGRVKLERTGGPVVLTQANAAAAAAGGGPEQANRLLRMDSTLNALVVGGGNPAALPVVGPFDWVVQLPPTVAIGTLVRFTSSNPAVATVSPVEVVVDAQRRARTTITRAGLGATVVNVSSPVAANIISRVVECR